MNCQPNRYKINVFHALYNLLFIFINYFVYNIGPEYLQHMWGYICPELLQAIESEPEPDVSAEMYDALGKVNNLK